MSCDAKPSPTSKLLTLVCLLLTLVLTLPCPAASPTQPMSARHCADCCPTSALATTSLCCEAPTQPAHLTVPQSLPQPTLVHHPLEITLTKTIFAPISTARPHPAPPPPLHPILRI